MVQIGSILVSGASRGIGLELVKQLSHLPSPPRIIFAACRQPDKANELQELAAKNSTIKVLRLDVTSDTDITSAVNLVQGIVGDSGLNVLVNNAGINIKGQGSGKLDTLKRDVMLQHFDTNAVSPLIICQKFATLLKMAAAKYSAAGFGLGRAAIINISSVMASISRNQGSFYQYRASKTALNMLTNCLKLEMDETGIAVIAMHPGWVQTDMGGAAADVQVNDSAQGILQVLQQLQEKQNGTLIDHLGQTIEW